jgi:hypothetical protein
MPRTGIPFLNHKGEIMDIYIELFGYLGSTLVVVSMLMASVVKLRVINTVGSVISATYAFIIGSFPLALMNICLIVINVYNLIKLLKTQQEYDLVCVGSGDAFVKYFVDRYGKDISNYFPEFAMTDGLDTAYMVCCNGDPAGLLLGKRQGDHLEVALDYTTPAYRDCSVGKFLYSRMASLEIHKLTVTAKLTADHCDYLRKMGFHVENSRFCKEI